MTSEQAAYFSILFDFGGIIGGIVAGIASDYTGKSASTCAVMLIAAIPMVRIGRWAGDEPEILSPNRAYEL